MTDTKQCPRCLGCGQLANSEDQEPWSAWASLPPGSDLAVRTGVVKPIPCPGCDGSGVAVDAASTEHPTAAVLDQVARERARQIELGWTIEHDDRYNVDHLVTQATRRAKLEDPDNEGYYSRNNLVKAAALLVAAIERLDRSER